MFYESFSTRVTKRKSLRNRLRVTLAESWSRECYPVA